MGLLSIPNPLRSRESRLSKLPLYRQLTVDAPTKERYSDDEYTSDDEVDDDITDYSSASPQGSSSSRRASAMSPSAHMLPKTRHSRAPRLAKPYLYRLPNKVVRYLCMGMIATIVLFILSLVRASQVENRKIAEGKVEKPAVPVPHTWESFDFLTRYYGGIRSLIPFAENVAQYPRAQDEEPYTAPGAAPAQLQERAEDETATAPTWRPLPSSKPFTGHPQALLPDSKLDIQECFLDAKNTLRAPPIRYYDGRPHGFPDNVLGSYELLSLPEDICFERFGRFGPYGYGYSTRSGGLGVGEHGEHEGSEAVWESAHQVDWRTMDWAETQRRCYRANAARFKPTTSRHIPPLGFYIDQQHENMTLAARDSDATGSSETAKLAASPPAPTSAPAAVVPPAKTAGNVTRTAVVVRCWDEYQWREEDVMNLRAVISELSLVSGGRYDVHLLVQVKNDAKNPIWADDDTYRNVIKSRIPAEFQGLVTLWTETQMLSLYQGIHDLFTRGPGLPVHGSYRGLLMAMQYFAYNHPEYDYFWQWEMDIRYTGHYHDLFSKLENWAREQPRKGLWERNARFYLPAVHGSWEDFKQMARVQSESGTFGAHNIWQSVPGASKDPNQVARAEESIWGPKRPVDEKDWFEYENDPTPPTSQERDKYTWGVGEEADLITLNPIFDPEATTWGLADDITGYNETEGIGKPPRRAQIITASRMSRTLLVTMHRETAFKKHHAFPEMWPATAALQHGLKAVFAPHPLFVDRAWPTEYMARVYNGGRNGASGGARTSVFGDREHNLRGLTWFYDSGFAPNMYRRWLGLRVNNDGGEEFELTPDLSKNDTTVPLMRGGEGRMCLPPMLIHPVKGIELPVEAVREDDEVPESDPAA